MKIIYIRLKNFAAIHAGMHKKEIEIDFNKCKNNIVLLVGPNGSGKTALLSTLHPFAYPDNGDQRSNNTMILKDHDGEKEIHYNVDGDIYVIKHFYKQNSRGMITKSFISKNGDELNPNGNVTSFMEIVFIELGIQSDYMKLLRLGSNVTNLIDLKAAERKKFTIGLFNDLDIWSDYYKKVNEETRLLKNLLNTVNSKIIRLNVSDINELKDRIDRISADIVNTTNNISDLKQKIGTIDGSISTMIPEGIDQFKQTTMSLRSQYNSLLGAITEIKKKMSSIGLVLIGDIDGNIDNLRTTTISLKSSIDVNKSYIDAANTKLNDYMNQLDDVEKQLSVSVSNEHLDALKKLKGKLTSDIAMIPESVRTYNCEIDKSSVMTAINILHEIDRTVSETYGFGMDAVRECINLVRAGSDVNTIIDNNINRIDAELDDLSLKVKGAGINRDNIIMYRPPNCPTESCPFMKLYDLISGADETETKSIKTLEHDKDVLMNMSAVYKNIQYIKAICNANAHISKGLMNRGLNYLVFDNIIDAMYSDKAIFNEATLTSIISDIEEHDEYISLNNKLKDVELSIMKASNTDSDKIVLEEKRRNLCEQIQSTRQEIRLNTDKVTSITNEYNSMVATLDIYEEYNSLMTELHEKVSEANSMGDMINDADERYDKLKEYETTKQLLNRNLVYNETKLKELMDDEFNDKYKLKSYKALMREKELINEKYEAYATARDALSPTKDGIQSVCVYLYLESTIMTVNKILASIYEDFQVVKFDIGDSEFNIPYIKNGITINDVSSASQGERSFLNIAISFALMEKAIDKYNVPLFDEIDATLDMRNRAMFLNILLDRIDAMNAEQLFMITHNNMFDSYPVDIIMTGDINLDSYKNSNIVFVNK